jgi:hypothetical protein
MKYRSKFVATALAAAFAACMLAAPASANSDKKPTTGVGILPALAGPVGVAGLVGTSTNHLTFTKFFKFYPSQKWGWYKIKYLKYHGWDVDKYYKHGKIKVHAKKTQTSTNRMTQGKAVVGCVMGSALGAISASIRKASALGNPIRWRSQAEHEAIVKSGYEKQFELTSDEAAIALSLCGLGSFALNWQAKAPMVVKAKY